MKTLTFKETQKFNGIAIIGLILFLLIGICWRFIEQNFINMSEQVSITLPVFLLLLFILGGSLAYFLSIRLITKINEKSVQFQYYPLHYRKRKIKWRDIASWEIVEMPLSAEWSGWNVHFGGQDFSVGRRQGLQITLKSGETIFLGSRKLNQLKEIMEKMGQ